MLYDMIAWKPQQLLVYLINKKLYATEMPNDETDAKSLRVG